MVASAAAAVAVDTAEDTVAANAVEAAAEAVDATIVTKTVTSPANAPSNARITTTAFKIIMQAEHDAGDILMDPDHVHYYFKRKHHPLLPMYNLSRTDYFFSAPPQSVRNLLLTLLLLCKFAIIKKIPWKRYLSCFYVF